MKKRLTIFLIFSIALFSCEKDKTENRSVSENKSELEQLSLDMDADVGTMMESEGYLALRTFEDMMVLNSPFEVSPPAVNVLALRKGLKRTTLSNAEPFVFGDHVGTYEWNFAQQSWDVTNTPADQIIIRFPTEGKTGETNNASIIIYDYQEEMVMKEDDYGSPYESMEPTLIDAELFVNDEKYVDVEFAADWNETGDPISLDVMLFVKPFTFEGTFNFSNKKATLTAKLSKENVQLLGTNLTADFVENNMDSAPVNLSGSVQYLDFELKGNVNIDALENLGPDATADDLNENINLKLYWTDGDFIADVEFYWNETEEDVDVQLVFEDDSVVPAKQYIEEIIQQIEAEFKEVM